MDITECCVPCQAFSAATFLLRLVCGPLPSVFEKLLCWVQVRWPLNNFPFLCLEKLLGSFRRLLWVIFHLHSEVLANHFCRICLNLSSPEHFTVQASASISCHIISKHQWPGSTSSHTCTCHNIASGMFDSLWYALDHELLLLFYSHRSGASLVSVQRMFFRTGQTVRCLMAVLVCNRGFAPCCKPSCRSHSCVSSGLRGTLHWLLVVRCYT